MIKLYSHSHEMQKAGVVPEAGQSARALLRAAHTPGPWDVSEGKPGFGTNRTHIRVIVPQPDRVCPLYVADCIREGSLDETRANARLIAAAPQLLEALAKVNELERRAVNLDDHVAGRAATYAGLLNDIGNIARAAIAKAAGVQS